MGRVQTPSGALSDPGSQLLENSDKKKQGCVSVSAGSRTQ